MTGILIRRGHKDTDTHSEGRPCENTGRKQPSAAKEKGHKKPILMTA